MRILQVDPDGRQLLKELDAYEMQYWANIGAIQAHLNNLPPYDNNPHNVIASQVSRDTSVSYWDPSDNVQLHTDNDQVHIFWKEGNMQRTAADVNFSKELDLDNTSILLKITGLYVNGLRYGLGKDYVITAWGPPGTIRFIAPDFPVGDATTNIEIDYRQKLP